MHPDALSRKRSANGEIGVVLGGDILQAFFNLKLSRKPERITEKLLWLGEIPRKIEAAGAMGKKIEEGSERDDFLLDDSALVYDGEEGLVILTGCSHSGICNIVDYAMTLTGKDIIADVTGGFHMLNADAERLRKTGEWLALRAPKTVHPCHCTDLKAKTAMARYLPIAATGVGLELKYR